MIAQAPILRSATIGRLQALSFEALALGRTEQGHALRCKCPACHSLHMASRGLASVRSQHCTGNSLPPVY